MREPLRTAPDDLFGLGETLWRIHEYVATALELLPQAVRDHER